MASKKKKATTKKKAAKKKAPVKKKSNPPKVKNTMFCGNPCHFDRSPCEVEKKHGAHRCSAHFDQ